MKTIKTTTGDCIHFESPCGTRRFLLLHSWDKNAERKVLAILGCAPSGNFEGEVREHRKSAEKLGYNAILCVNLTGVIGAAEETEVDHAENAEWLAAALAEADGVLDLVPRHAEWDERAQLARDIIGRRNCEESLILESVPAA